MWILKNSDLWLSGYIFVPFNQMNLRQNVHPSHCLKPPTLAYIVQESLQFLVTALNDFFYVTKIQSLLTMTKISWWVILPFKIYIWFSTGISHPVGNPKFCQGIFRNCRDFYYSLVTSGSSVHIPLNSLSLCIFSLWLCLAFSFLSGFSLLHSHPLNTNAHIILLIEGSS